MKKQTKIIISVSVAVLVLLLVSLFIIGPYVKAVLNTPDFSTEKIVSKDATLYLDGKPIECDNVKVYHYTRDKVLSVKIREKLGLKITEFNDDSNADQVYEQIPLTVVLKQLGAEITWVDDYHADIVLDDINYKLDIEKSPCLYRDFAGPEHNFFDLLVGGCNPYGNNSKSLFTTAHREVLCDTPHLSVALTEMSKHVYVETDYEQGTINVIFRGTIIDYDSELGYIYAE